MKCNFCGHENDDSNIICVSCGEIMDLTSGKPANDIAPEGESVDLMPKKSVVKSSNDELIETPPAMPNSIVTPEAKADTTNTITKDSPSPKKEINKKKIIIPVVSALAIIIVATIAIAVFSGSKPKISINDYTIEEIAFSGINGYGKFDVDSIDDIIECNQLSKDLRENSSKKKSKEVGDYYSDYYNNYSDIEEYLSFECTSNNNGTLTNGDTVEFLVTIDYEKIANNDNYYKKLSEKEPVTFTYTVSGLGDGVAINVFDAVEAFTYDTTSYYSEKISLKKDFEKAYEKGIKLKVENNTIRIYGDDFYSFSVGVKTITDNIDENSTSAKLVLNCAFDEYMKYGIVFNPTEQSFKPKIITRVKDNTFSAKDQATLTEKAKTFAFEKFSKDDFKLEKAIIYYDSASNKSRISYFFKGAEFYYVVYYQDLKQANDGSIVDIDDSNPQIDGWFGYSQYKTIKDYENSLIFTNQYSMATK